jgi:hypothetical protein
VAVNTLFHQVSGRERIRSLHFSQEEVKVFWKYKEYPECPKSDSQVFFKGKKLYIDCLEENPRFNQDLLQPQFLGGSIGAGNIWKYDYERKKEAQHLIVKCSSYKEDYFAFVFNNYDDSISKKAEEISKTLKITEKKPFTVLILVFDSVSRASARINWPQTVKYLESLESYDFIDFKVSTTTGINTRPNMVPLIYGQSEEFHDKFLQGEDYKKLSSYPAYQKLQEFSIWRFFSRLGYTTMFSYDTVFDFMVKSFGRKIYADHVFVNFWKVAFRVFGFHDFSEKQRCLGQEDSHFYSLDYTFQYLTNYKKNNRFAYVHMDAAHENSGNVKTVDKDLVAFLRKTLEWYQEQNQEIVIFLLGDHGRINPNMKFNEKGFMDQRTPLTFLVCSPGIERKWKSLKSLKESSEELIGRYDIHLSMKEIAFFPYERWTLEEYLNEKKKIQVDDVISFFRESPKKDRTCEDIGVTRMFCNIKEFQIIDKKDQFDLVVKMKILDLVKNTFEYCSFRSQKKCLAPQVEDLQVKKFELMPYGRGWDTLYEFEGVVDKDLRFKGRVNFCTFKRIVHSKHYLPVQSYPATTFQVNETKVFIQMTSFDLDDCNLDYCICKENILIKT